MITRLSATRVNHVKLKLHCVVPIWPIFLDFELMLDAQTCVSSTGIQTCRTHPVQNLHPWYRAVTTICLVTNQNMYMMVGMALLLHNSVRKPFFTMPFRA